MENVELAVHKKKKTNQIILIGFLCICLLIGFLCFSYYQELQETVENESSEYLQEISTQIVNNTNKTISDNFSVLKTIETVITTSNITTFNALQPLISEQQNVWNYQNILMIDKKGKAYDTYGKRVVLSDDDFLLQSVIGRTNSLAASQVINGKEFLLFTIPVADITIDGTDIVALSASYDVKTLDQMLTMNFFDGKGCSNIIKHDGTVIVHSNSKNAPAVGTNIFSSLADAKLDKGSNLEQIRTDIEKGISGRIGFSLDDIHYYMTYMSVKGGNWCLLTYVPVSVVNGKSEMLLTITLLICSFITIIFALLFTYLMVSAYRHKRKLETLAYVDPVTDGHTIQRFYELAETFLTRTNHPPYAVVYSNIEKFKILNEQFGRRLCDDLLYNLHKSICKDLTTNECVGRLAADHFCVFLEYKNKDSLLERLHLWYENINDTPQALDSFLLAPTMTFGVYIVTNESMPFPSMIDRAKLALRELTPNLQGKVRCALYDDEIRRRLFREKHLEDRMDYALKNGEFKVFMQPKYNVHTETISGAEALVRWISHEDGMIFPDEFIALFEKNGFIISLDLWVFEQVCCRIRHWLDFGLTPIKISVNCSRVQLSNPHFLDNYIAICTKHNVPTKYLEIELTESVVFEDVAHLIHIITEIHNAGFGCSMDDFGSGYSSLNLIQDIPVDTIKLDRIFFKNIGNDTSRSECVIGSILSMAQQLNMKTVAEGVEGKAQVDMLKRLGCDLIQGYYFAKPMPIPEFEILAFS